MSPFQGGDTGSNPVGGTQPERSGGAAWPCSPPCQGGGRGFESRPDRKGRRTGPVGEEAQLAEHRAENGGVGSSIWPLATDPSGTRLEVQGRTSLANRAMQSEISVLFPALAMHRSNLVKTPVLRA